MGHTILAVGLTDNEISCSTMEMTAGLHDTTYHSYSYLRRWFLNHTPEHDHNI